MAEMDSVILPIRMAETIVGLDQGSAVLPSGAYTTFRTYSGNRLLKLADHIRRLEISAELSGVKVDLDESIIRCAVREAISSFQEQLPSADTGVFQSPTVDLRLRLILTLDKEPFVLYLLAEELHSPPPEAYSKGVSVITTQLERSVPEAKLTSFIQRSSDIRQKYLSTVNEVVMIDGAGFLSEGISSNFFAVLDGAIHTAGDGVLPGITRALVLEQAVSLGIPVVFEPVHSDQIPNLDEAFISSSSRGLLPVCMIDQQKIGSGCPGRITQRLIQAYKQAVQNLSDPVE